MLVMRLKNRQGFYRHPPLSLSFTATLAAREKLWSKIWIHSTTSEEIRVVLHNSYWTFSCKQTRCWLCCRWIDIYLGRNTTPPIPSIHIHTSLTMINGTQFKKNPHFVEKKNLVSTCILIPLFPSCANLQYLALLNAWILSINLFYSFHLKIGRKNNVFIMKKKQRCIWGSENPNFELNQNTEFFFSNVF